MSKANELIPSARRLIGSLRDMGYEFAPAVADLIDNSVEAGATEVDVWIEFKGDESWVRIADNGRGMSAKVLREAMRYGSEREYVDGDLGKFGLGMKTASMSQCRCLTVASRPKGSSAFTAFRWDLDHISKADKWEILPVVKNKLPRSIGGMLKKGFSTVVLWEQLDRILGYKHPYGEFQRKQLAQMSREVEDHLAMVFHRFLSGEARRRRIKISLNGNPVEPWDPFCRKEERTRKLEGRSLPIEQDGVTGEVLFEPFVLPHQNRFSTSAAHDRASGPRKWNRQQGFYIYRADRLIQSGGWSGLRVQDEHTKLARVGLSFNPKLDEAFKINVAKMRVQLPAQLRGDLERLLAPVIRAADSEYRNSGASANGGAGGSGSASRGSSPEPSRSAGGASTNASASSNGSGANGHDVKTLFTVDEVLALSLAVSTAEEKPVVRSVFSKIERPRVVV
ncbi:MAG TPA: ATP-binding protein [Candidatus Didemnitutus sp.]|jgi:hypothetical protein